MQVFRYKHKKLKIKEDFRVRGMTICSTYKNIDRVSLEMLAFALKSYYKSMKITPVIV